MKHKLNFAVVCTLLLGALVFTEVRRVDAPVGPEAILYFIADSQRELTRLPMVYTRIPDRDEVEIGKSMTGHYGLGSKAADEETKQIHAYIQKVGNSLARHAERKLPFEFRYINDVGFVNAFALPGGPVYIGAGLLVNMRSEDELAAVLGHEIEHIDHYHCAERLQWEAALRKIPLGSAFQIPAAIFQAGYSKEQELEADREGTALAVKAGYSPRGAVLVFEEFARLRKELLGPPRRVSKKAKTPVGEITGVPAEILRGYFRSHPSPEDRKAGIERAFAGEIAGSKALTPFEFAYVFLTYRANRAFEMASAGDPKERATQEKWQEALKLANESLALKADQPAALRVLGQTQLALGNIAGANDAYKKLVGKYPVQADAIRGYADALTVKATEAKNYPRALTMVRFSLSLQPNHVTGLKTLAQLQLAQDDLAGAESTAAKLKNLYPGEVQYLAADAAKLARDARTERDYPRAVRLFDMSLRLAAESSVMRELAETHFVRGDFPAAAPAFRKLLGDRTADLGLIQLYAESLGAAGRAAEGVREFEAWMNRSDLRGPGLANDARIELAGLHLRAGNRGPAEKIREAASQQVAALAPEKLARLIHWYGKAGDGRTALEIALAATQQRPADPGLQNELGWALIQQRDYAKAEMAFRRVSQSGRDMFYVTGNAPEVGASLSQWSQGRSDAALSDFASAAETYPHWLNPVWVRAVNPPRIAEAVLAIHEARRADEQFLDANFAASAATYRKFAEEFPGDAAWIRRYSTALSALGNPEAGLREFQGLLQKAPRSSPEAKAQSDLDLAGLSLLAGDAGKSEQWVLEMPRTRKITAENGTRLAWWHYRAGKTPQAVENLLRGIAQSAPNDAGTQVALAWVELERGNFRGALERFARGTTESDKPGAAHAVGRAVLLWRTGPAEQTRALDAYEAFVKASPHWRNPAWVKALTPPAVVADVAALEAALKKRLAERKE